MGTCRGRHSFLASKTALMGEEPVPGIIVVVQTFGDRINFHPHRHLPVTEGGVDKAGIFHSLPA